MGEASLFREPPGTTVGLKPTTSAPPPPGPPPRRGPKRNESDNAVVVAGGITRLTKTTPAPARNREARNRVSRPGSVGTRRQFQPQFSSPSSATPTSRTVASRATASATPTTDHAPV